VRLPLAAEILAARAAARLSRLTGRGGGTTVPGKLLWKLDPTAVDRLAERLSEGSALISATNGKTTTAAMAAEILRPAYALAHNASGANLMSGVASTLLAASGAELGLFEVDEGALPEVAARTRPRALCLGNLFRDQLDRYGELELVAERWRAAVTSLPSGATLAVNGDDPQVGPKRGPDPLEHGPVLWNPVEGSVEGLGSLAGDLPEEVGLRVDVGVQRAFLHAERLGEVADRGAVVALLGEEPGGCTG